MPATYLVAPSGIIMLARIDADYRNRLEPSELLCAVRELQTVGSGLPVPP